ncbi:MAG: stage V sporulation protein AD [Ruminococcaceae bacterium]|nr:stage V sporulation protein AD [Oscillospiraceae bacterium]
MSIIKINDIYIKECASVVGKNESEGPLGKYFDLCENDMRFGEDSWEMAESELTRRCIEMLLTKSGKKGKDVSLVTGGDLLNQCISSAFAVSENDIPYLGLYGACSTCAEGLVVGAIMAEKLQNDVISFASSHFCSAEKQFRFPLEYGGQRTPTSQSTVTGSGAFLLSKSGKIKVTEGLIGRVKDGNITDVNNMGAAMAPAAADTLMRYFVESGTKPSDFDVIATGDLGMEGHELTKQLMMTENVVMGDCFTDCGLMIYDMKKQDMHAGGSGCGCSAAVTAGHFCRLLEKGEIKNLLLVGTGALLSKTSANQGRTIPAVAHLVRLESVV